MTSLLTLGGGTVGLALSCPLAAITSTVHFFPLHKITPSPSQGHHMDAIRAAPDLATILFWILFLSFLLNAQTPR